MDLLTATQALLLLCLFLNGRQAIHTLLLLCGTVVFLQNPGGLGGPVRVKKSIVSIYNSKAERLSKTVPVQLKIQYRNDNLSDLVSRGQNSPVLASLAAR